MGLDIRYVAAGLGLVAAGFFFLRTGDDEQARVPPPQKGSKTPSKTQILAPSEQKEKALNPQQLDSLRRAHNLKLSMQVKALPAKAHGNRLTISVKTALEAVWCKSGDFDLIKSVVKDAAKKDFAITLEALDGSSLQQGVNLSFADISRGTAVRMTLPKVKEARAVGLYLCSDPGNKRSCRERAPLPADIWTTAVDKMPAKVKDKIIYFQYLILDSSGVQLLPSQDWSAARFATMQKTLKDDLGASAREFEKARKLIAHLQPMPARLSGEILEIPLPYNDPRCAQ